jgi:hypothetical protein
MKRALDSRWVPVAYGAMAALAVQAGLVQARLDDRAPAIAALVAASRTGTAPAAKPKPAPSPVAAPAAARAKPLGRGSRAEAPLAAVASSGPEQAGYVHYFVIQGPDDEPEIQIGIELADRRIAWSFPGLGVVISPFLEEGVVAAGDGEFYVWHLYGIRPFPGEADMAKLGRELPARIRPWLAARTPHCENESANADCMSCLGFVLRALFPGRGRAPALPRDWPAGAAGKYTTRDLLLYLTGMVQLPTREARLQRIAGAALPAELRDELEHLVYFMSAVDTAAPADTVRPSRHPGSQPKTGARPPQRRKLGNAGDRG